VSNDSTLHRKTAAPAQLSTSQRRASASAGDVGAVLFRVALASIARRRLRRGLRDLSRQPHDLLWAQLTSLAPPPACR
jgi:hypothetical protein